MLQRLLITFPVLALLAGCTGRQTDSLKAEKESMEAEAKALAQHQSLPAPSRSIPSPSGSTASAPQVNKTGNRLPAGTAVKIITTMSLSTRTATIGQEWTGKLTEDVVDSSGRAVAKAGAPVKGRVVLVSDGTNLRRKQEIEMRVFQVQAMTGEHVDIHTTTFVRSGAEEGKRPAIVENDARIDFQLASSAVFPQ